MVNDLFKAVKVKNLIPIKDLLRDRADINKKDKGGETALHILEFL